MVNPVNVSDLFSRCMAESGDEQLTATTVATYITSPFTIYCNKFAPKDEKDEMAEQNARQMSQMMDMINELKTQVNSTKNNKSDELEFCCIKCSTIHKNQKCPVCDSKLKRIYE